jgi:hypothetical protein
MRLHRRQQYKVRARDFDSLTRELVRRWEEERRRAFAVLLAADPIPPLEDVPIGAVVRFATEVRT